ncbi:MAG TPA: glycosyltransferase family 1 protein [Opitutae bacterium]|nr:glycosyltransferase family 1 protein [Opitutae bacterium]|tara:strand:+ start:1781 stop:2917 length:1137 start_codon:yes stop_codon:yes gene_type:complete
MEVHPQKSRRSIVMLTHEFFPQHGGIAVYTEEMARAAVRLGHDVEVWAPEHDALRAKAKNYPFKIKTLELKGSQGWPCRIALARAILAEKDTLKHKTLYLPEPGPIASCMYLQLLTKIPCKDLIVTLHGSEILTFTALTYRTALFKKLLKQAARVSAVSHFSKNLLESRIPSMKGKLAITPGTLRHDFESVSPRRESKETIHILTVGRIHPRKGQLATVEALSKLEPYLKSRIEYSIVGPTVDRPYKRAIERLAKRSSLSVKFTNSVDKSQLKHLYASADIFALTSMPYKKSVEGYGLVYLEAGAFGLPSIAHDIGGVAEALEDKKTGLLASPYDRMSLTQAFKQVIQSQKLRETLGNNAELKAHKYTWDDRAKVLFS